MEVCFRSAGGAKARRDVEPRLAEARRLAQRVGSPDALAMADIAEGYVRFFQGAWNGSIAAFVRAEETLRDRCVGVHWQLGSTRTMLYRAMVMSGRLGELRARFAPVLRDARERGDRFTELNIAPSAVVNLELAADRPDRARDELLALAPKLPAGAFLVQHYYHLLFSVRVELYRGEGTLAHARLMAALPRIRKSLLMRVESLRAQTAEALVGSALIAHAETGKDEWLARAEEHLAIFASCSTPWTTALGKLAHAAIAARRGSKEELASAAVALEAAGLALHAAAARHVVGDETGTRALIDRGVVTPDRFARVLAFT
jgi:hypothetical protein